ncbi:hypothetical protein FRC19_009702 [Serendipita sp. 401]|nr:hypothetical protein FRC19_009702 [Serendipita sp. 401]KAG8837721.1 hypothetical protein FRC18_008223 [Serendipita sp. 400]KAG9057013.1 hypothetical protein FS842_008946 [Serendipita sp. 407]
MEPKLPSSISPHVTTILSPDLTELLSTSSLPPLHHILQSYSPLPIVTTRTTALTPVQHKAFHLRFSNLEEIELACKEDEETRSSRFIDWMGTRISRRASKWVDDLASRPPEAAQGRMPWWEEIRKCVEGDWVPSRTEGWNHPTSIIYAVSTMAPNPIQAISHLYARHIDLPPWVDPTFLRFILIVHPKKSTLNADECTALLNAIRKQYGLHVHFLNLTLEPGPSPIPIVSLPPQLPLPSTVQLAHVVPDTSELWMSETDAMATGKFVREFLTQSLIPWMEKNVLEWNEAFINKGRLPSRLISSTRRLFGTTGVVPSTPITSQTPSFSSMQSATSSSPPPQTRRLAELATFLGDYKLAVQALESLRKEGKGGSAILPLLLSPSSSLISYAAQALAPVFAEEPSATSLHHALVNAIRWESGIHAFSKIGGERWLVWAASTAEEAPTALLLGRAAFMSKLKGAKRKAALWYVMSAHRLEKCGIKALTAHYLREARSLYSQSPQKSFSPAYAESEKWPPDGKEQSPGVYPLVLASIDHSLGRIKYSSGETEAAVRLFLGILRYSTQLDMSDTDEVVIDDFRQALQHLESTHPTEELPSDLILPIRFCVPNQCTVRLGGQNESFLSTDKETWESLEQIWTDSRRKRKGKLERPSAEIGRQFWLDVVLENPLETDVLLKRFTIHVSTSSEVNVPQEDIAIAQVIDEIHLYAKERRTVSIGLTPKVAKTLVLTEARYYFFSNLPVKEPLSIRGKRLNDTVAQRQEATYAPSQFTRVPVRQVGCMLSVEQVDEDDEEGDEDIVMVQGEIYSVVLRITNRGIEEINEVWLTAADNISIWIDPEKRGKGHDFPEPLSGSSEEISVHNIVTGTRPFLLPLETLTSSPSLPPGHFIDVHFLLHSEDIIDSTLNILVTYSNDADAYFYTCFARNFEIIPALSVSASIDPTSSDVCSYTLRAEVENISDDLEIELAQLSTSSTDWVIHPPHRSTSLHTTILPHQTIRRAFTLGRKEGSETEEIKELVVDKVSEFLLGKGTSERQIPDTTLRISHDGTEHRSLAESHLQFFIRFTRMRQHIRALTEAFPTVPRQVLQSLFPLYGPNSVDIIILWKLPSSARYGLVTFCDMQTGVAHGLLDRVIEQAMERKGKSIYAETKREHELLLQHFKECVWNRETDPLVVSVRPSQPVFEHDFTRGACPIPVQFTVRNYSPTNPVRYVLRLSGSRMSPTHLNSFVATYSGQLTYHRLLPPSQSTTVNATLRARWAGQYLLDGWRLEVDVGEAIPIEDGTPQESNPAAEPWKTRARYLQHPTGSEGIILIKNLVQHNRGTIAQD